MADEAVESDRPALGRLAYAVREVAVLVGGFGAMLAADAALGRMGTAHFLASAPGGSVREILDFMAPILALENIAASVFGTWVAHGITNLWPSADDGAAFDALGAVRFVGGLNVLVALFDLPWKHLFGG